MNIYPRFLEPTILALNSISPIVLLSGARQVGKSTLSRKISHHYILLDDVSIRNSALSDPNLFIRQLKKPVCLDEIQKVPELLESIKIDVDQNRNNGDYLLTGSANILDMQNIGDTLAGRLIEINMWPLSCKEISLSLINIIDELIDPLFINSIEVKSIDLNQILNTIISGGYPSALAIKDSTLRGYWFSSYISSYIERDIRDIGEIRNLPQFIKLFNLLASRSANLLNIKSLANIADINEATVKNYLTLLQMVFQIKLLPPYATNINKRLIKTPKLFFTDSGILAHLLNVQTTDELLNSPYKGLIIETFVYSELIKHISYSSKNILLTHYRTHDQNEIDFILEYSDRIIAIEVKSSSKIDEKAFRHIKSFQKQSEKCKLGIVFYLGNKVLRFGESLIAIPLSYFY
jgi:hypothetical protein